MTLDEAIRIMTINNDHNPYITDTQRHQAHQLGIEALKLVDNLRFDGSPYYPKLLPGETEE